MRGGGRREDGGKREGRGREGHEGRRKVESLLIITFMHFFFIFLLFRLMGPRRKLTLAISELKEQEQERKNQRSKGDGSKKKNGCNDDRSCTRRAQLMKQSSTDVTEAYRQVCTLCPFTKMILLWNSSGIPTP